MKAGYLIALGALAILLRSKRKKEMKLSSNFSLREFTRSATAIRNGWSNEPGPMELAALMALVNNVLQPARDLLVAPINVSSGYRSPQLNAAIGGATSSQHLKGEAADISAGAKTAELFYLIRDRLPFDQLIWELGTDARPEWIHVSYKQNGTNRGQVLRYWDNGTYTNF